MIQRFRNVNNIGSSFSLTSKINFLVALCKIKGRFRGGKEIHEWKESFTKSDAIF